MIKKVQPISSSALLLSFLLLFSCRSSDTDQVVNNGTPTAISIDIRGSDFATGTDTQASVKYKTTKDDSQQITMLTPGTYVISQTTPTTSSGTNRQALSRIPATAVAGSNLAIGTRFRVIAYKKAGSYQDYRDYTVTASGIQVSGGKELMLDHNVTYTMVAYSYNSSALPAITGGEKGSIGTASVSYDDTNPDLMYWTGEITPKGDLASNPLSITFRHKLTLIESITIKTNGTWGNITQISSTGLEPHYRDGAIPFSSGIISGRTTRGANKSLIFSGINTQTLTATPDVFINADVEKKSPTNPGGGVFQITLTIVDNSPPPGSPASKTQTVDLPFSIKPEYRQALTYNIRKCGAYTGPNRFTEFDCHNMGADRTVNPFVPAAAIHGGKYQWGYRPSDPLKSDSRYLTQYDDQINPALPSTSWNNLSTWQSGRNDLWLNGGEYNPCLTGFKVPSQADWQSVIDNNSVETVGTFQDNNNNYTSAFYIINKTSRERILMLPAAGFRRVEATGAVNGYIEARGKAFYWSANASDNGRAYQISVQGTGGIITFVQGLRSIAEAVRCMKI